MINTLCENALIHGYANQSRSISPEIIAEIAADFRLNVRHSSIADSIAAPQVQGERSGEIERAARTLLDLYAYLRTAQESGADLRIPLGAGGRKNEPYI